MSEQDPQTGEDAHEEAGSRRSARGEGERHELGKRALAAARRTAESKAVIPHLYALGRIAAAASGSAPAEAAVLAAVGSALRERPRLNSTYRDGVITEHSRVNVGVVTESPEGPLVPTLFDADRASVEEIERELEAMREGAAAGSLASPDLAGGTFTVTFAADPGGPLLVPVPLGQSGHLAVCGAGAGGGEDVTLGLACDARAVGGAEAASFLRRIEALAVATGGD